MRVKTFGEACDKLRGGTKYIQVYSPIKTGWNKTEFQEFAAILSTNSTCEKLELFHWKLGNDEARHVAVAMKTNTSLTYLDLSSNSLGPSGAEILATFLEKNKHLKTLRLNRNGIDSSGARAILIGLKDNKDITCLRINDPHTIIDSRILSEIDRLLLRNMKGDSTADPGGNAMNDSTAGNVAGCWRCPSERNKWVNMIKEWIESHQKLNYALREHKFLMQDGVQNMSNRITVAKAKEIFLKLCKLLIEYPLTQYTNHVKEALQAAGAVQIDGSSSWVFPQGSFKPDVLKSRLDLMNRFWNEAFELNEAPMSLVGDFLLLVNRIAEFLRNSEGSEPSRYQNGLFVSHYGQTRKAYASALYQYYGRKLNGVPVFIDYDGITRGADNVLEMCYAVCQCAKIVGLLEGNYFTSKYCVMEMFLACAKKFDPINVDDSKYMPVILTDILMGDVKNIFLSHAPLPFSKNVSWYSDTSQGNIANDSLKFVQDLEVFFKNMNNQA